MHTTPPNCHERRAAARGIDPKRRATTIAEAMAALAASPTATGATLIFPDGSSVYLDAADARAMNSADAPKGGAA